MATSLQQAVRRFGKFRRKVARRLAYRPLVSKRRGRSRVIIPRAIKNQQIHRFKRYSDSVVKLYASNTGNSLRTYELPFTLENMQGQGEITALFDQYRIRAVKVEITPSGQFITNDRTVTGANSLDAEGTGYWLPPRLYAVIDYNDDNALASISDAQEYSTCKIIPYDKKYTKFYFTPCVNMEVALDADTTARTATKYAMWLSTSNTNIQHYGMKFLMHNPNTNNVGSSYATASWLMRVTYYIECKNVN